MGQGGFAGRAQDIGLRTQDFRTRAKQVGGRGVDTPDPERRHGRCLEPCRIGFGLADKDRQLLGVRVDRVARRVGLRLAGPMEQAESAIAQDQTALALVQARADRGLAFVALFKALGGAPLPMAQG